MDAVFPITQRNGEPYHTLSDFTKLFDQVKSGRYLLGQGYGWHSGVHLTSKMVPWGKGLRPIQAMMDGKIVAYRIHADYQTTTYKDQELKYSNNFVLLEHEYKNPEKDDEVFKLYSLYMHLAPPSDIGANSSLTTRYKLVDDGWNVRTFKLGGDPKRGQVESKVSMSSGTVLEYLHAEEQETVKFEIGDHTYKMIKCRVVQLGDSPSSSEKQMKGKIVWFAAGKDSDFDILNDTSVMVPEPVSEPEWMSKNAASLRDGSVVTLGLPLPLNIDFGAIEVKAGDELGYMGLHEYSNDAHATKKEDNRVHIELFSIEKPPEFFLKNIAPKNAEESPLITIDGSGSDGALSVSNSFYSQLLEELSKGEEIDFSAFKPREAKVYLENKRKHFERVIAKHPSDWYTDVTKDSYSMIHQLAKEVMDEKYMTGFVSEKDYLESPWRSEVMNHHEIFSQHELERADKFSWMQDTQSKITLPDDKSVWHYWPFSVLLKSCTLKPKCNISNFYTVGTSKGVARISKLTFDKILEIEKYEPKPYVPENSDESGITIGYGYDLGHQDRGTALKELTSVLGESKTQTLIKVLGKKGDIARSFLSEVSNITIDITEAKNLAWIMKKRYVLSVVDSYPESIKLHPHCQGALLSLVINRGHSFGSPTNRKSWSNRKEMRDIAKHLQENKVNLISNDIRSMKRLWEGKGLSGLISRREFEAKMFDDYGDCKCFQE
ncbi:hypothetical protein F0223_06115 [Vibrio coralliilyticus]|uniref:hypothetical protein n=1 Tax=Vibrio TaxID=662 RepID=UPI000AC40315|nr:MULTISPECIES: hypothetical protein [Vibrio]NOI17805.1 hypothetical protein [Vibrio coralliilyticus]